MAAVSDRQQMRKTASGAGDAASAVQTVGKVRDLPCLPLLEAISAG